MAKEVWSEKVTSEEAKSQHQASMIFPIGEPNDAYAQYFTGQSYLASVTDE